MRSPGSSSLVRTKPPSPVDRSLRSWVEKQPTAPWVPANWLPTRVPWAWHTDLAREILRFGSQPAGEDPLLTLEVESRNLSRPLLVVIDSPQSRAVVAKVCRQLDGTLRQVLSGNLRFLLVLRTPPEIELAPYPVLSAAVMPGQGQRQGAEPSLRLDRWDAPPPVRCGTRSGIPPNLRSTPCLRRFATWPACRCT